jgi:hypothetical protein
VVPKRNIIVKWQIATGKPENTTFSIIVNVECTINEENALSILDQFS